MDAKTQMDPARNFTQIGPDDLAGKYLRRFWQPVHLSADLPPKKAKPLKILGEEFTIYRGAHGEPHVVGAFCPHRNTRLSIGIVEGDRIRCFYHGWAFNGAGQCVHRPAESEEPTGVSIPSYPTHEYLGLIFCYFGPGEPPRFPRFDVYEDGGYIDADASLRHWSFFDQLENSVDEVHFNFVHRRSKFTDVGLNDQIPKLSAEETDYGILRIGERKGRVRHSHILMPNCMYSMVFEQYRGWCEHLAWRVPVDENSHISFMIDCVHKEGPDLRGYLNAVAEHERILSSLESAESVIDRCLRGEIHVDEIEWRPDMVLIQDGVAMQALRRPRDRLKDHLMTSDRQVVLLRKLWRRELGLLSRGEPIKAWFPPATLVPTSGVASAG